MSTLALDRQIRPIYDALDTGSNKSAVVAATKVLKKHPKNELVKALKALALVRLQKVEEALALCDEVLALKPTDDSILSAMMHVLRGLGRHKDMVAMFEDAYKQQPGNEELGSQTFFAHVRAGHWKTAQQIATKMFKQFQEERYLYWSVIGAILQANDVATPENMRNLLYKLAHRLITSSPTPSYLNADRFHLHLSILKKLELYDDAHKLLDSDVGRSVCATNLSCNEVRREIWRARGMLREEGEQAEKLVADGDRNWLEFLAILDATFLPLSGPSEPSEEARSECTERISKAHDIFTDVMEKDGPKDRSGLLALLELEKRARQHTLSSDPNRLLDLMEKYFHMIADKACCFEDLKPYVELSGDELSRWTAFLESTPTSFTTVDELRRLINSHKLLRYTLSSSQLTIDAESARASLYVQQYLEGLKLGASLPPSELQPADDLVLLAGNVLVNLWKLTNDQKYLLSLVAILEFALTKSKQSFLVRLLLIRVYRILGASSLALEHYRFLQVKQIQNDTLSHFILSRASTFSLAATGDLTLATECLESSQVYLSNAQETADFIVRAFTSEKYSQIPEFITFEDQLENSLQRDTVKMEHLRMRVTHEPVSSDIIDMELIELKFIFDRLHFDNRDYAVLPEYQPHSVATLNDQTLLFGKKDGLAWLRSLLKVYIRAFQQASDLDETVEEKLLIGDRPKLSVEASRGAPLKERVRLQPDDDFSELTEDEVSLVKYGHALADWLEPHHDHIRPPAAVVLAAAAAKQAELKGGKSSLKAALDTPPAVAGSPANGHAKKDEEPPVVQDAPEVVTQFFEKIRQRFKEVQAKENRSPLEALHVAALAQEAFLIFVAETLRFKSPSVIKIHKLGALSTSFKSIRANAATVLREISAALAIEAEKEGAPESVKAFVKSCEDDAAASQLDREFVVGVGKRFTESKKKVVEGVGKGLARLSATYTHP